MHQTLSTLRRDHRQLHKRFSDDVPVLAERLGLALSKWQLLWQNSPDRVPARVRLPCRAESKIEWERATCLVFPSSVRLLRRAWCRVQWSPRLRAPQL